MSKERFRHFHWCGVAAPLWLLIGVTITALLYPGYSHYDQAMSELGALGSPTQSFSPLINNYPLAILFCLFGLSVVKRFPSDLPARVSGYMIITHGVFTFTAGYFPCDEGCYQIPPSTSQVVHNISGGIMFLGLTVANAIWAIKGRPYFGNRFAQFSLLCLILSLAVIAFVPVAMESRSGMGLYQRINYGTSLLWLLSFAWFLVKHPPNTKSPKTESNATEHGCP